MRLIRSCFTMFILLSALWLLGHGSASAQANPASQTNPAKQAATAPAAPQAATLSHGAPAPEFIGSDTCSTCHADVTKNFDTNPHARLALQHGGKGVTCESCHGSAKEHVESGGDPTKIFSFKTATAKQASAKCLDCHATAHPNFERSPHGEAGIGCLNCHSVHAAKVDENLLKAKQVTLCTSCHADVRPAFSQAFHHKVNEGLMNCSDCHDPHGSFEKKNLKTAADQNQVCIKCHSDTAGPFVYEHPPIKTEGCVSCHSPHGSPNPRMLTRSNVNLLCMQCHTASSMFTTPGTPSFHNQANQYQACTVCHTQVHGSNSSAVFFK